MLLEVVSVETEVSFGVYENIIANSIFIEFCYTPVF